MGGKFSKMVNKFGVSSSRILFKTAFVKLLDEYPKMKNTLIPLHFLQENMNIIREVCRGDASKCE